MAADERIREGITQTAEQATRAGEEAYGELRGRAAEYYDEGVERARRMRHSLEGYIHERPFGSVIVASACALCAGFVIGMLARR